MHPNSTFELNAADRRELRAVAMVKFGLLMLLAFAGGFVSAAVWIF